MRDRSSNHLNSLSPRVQDLLAYLVVYQSNSIYLTTMTACLHYDHRLRCCCYLETADVFGDGNCLWLGFTDYSWNFIFCSILKTMSFLISWILFARWLSHLLGLLDMDHLSQFHQCPLVIPPWYASLKYFNLLSNVFTLHLKMTRFVNMHQYIGLKTLLLALFYLAIPSIFCEQKF